MAEEGIRLPKKFPANPVEAKDYKEAKKKVLALTSQYGTITDEGLYEFIHEAGLDLDEIVESFAFPGIRWEKFLEGWGSEIIASAENTNKTEGGEGLSFKNKCPKCGYEW